jgi:hypothetical protein
MMRIICFVFLSVFIGTVLIRILTSLRFGNKWPLQQCALSVDISASAAEQRSKRLPLRRIQPLIDRAQALE